MATEALIYVALILNAFFSSVIILFNAALLYLLRVRKVASKEIDEISLCFKQATKAAEFGKIPAVQLALIAATMQMPLDDVVGEYEKDSMERRAIVYSVLGENSLSKNFLNEFRSQFMLVGYEGEEQLLMK